MPATPGPKVFISYRREDTAGDANWLEEHLVSRFGADSVFMDIDSIQPGTDWAKALESYVTNSDVLLALIGPRWLTVTNAEGGRRLEDPNDWVRAEIGSALAHGTRVIPVLLHEARMPSPADLPPDLAELTRRQAIEIADSYRREGLERLLAAVRPGSRRIAPTGPSRRPVAAISAAVVVIAVAALAAFRVWGAPSAVKTPPTVSPGIAHNAAIKLILGCNPLGSNYVRCGVQGSGFRPDEQVHVIYHNADLKPGTGLRVPPGATLSSGAETVPVTTNASGSFTRTITLGAHPDFRLSVAVRGSHGEFQSKVWTGLPS